MNFKILREYIKGYKLDFERINQEENYKWKAVKCFQDNWDIEAENFHEMLAQSIRLTGNLLMSAMFFPYAMLLEYAEKRPEVLRNLFRNLFVEENDLCQRIDDFQKGIESLNSELFEGKKSYQEQRAVIVYLTLRFPEKYFFYKFRMFKKFSEKINIFYIPKQGRIENIRHFNSLCEIIKYELSGDKELLRLHKNSIKHDCYYDENLNILTQDFIYAVVNYLKHIDYPIDENSVTVNERKILANELENNIEPPNFKGRTVDFEQNNIENKRIGDLGEDWVLKYEEKKLERAGKQKWIKKIKYTAKEKGDGEGYDIESCDGKGKTIYIEVKTTKGPMNTTFYVTRTELERRKQEGNNYFLYRLYNYNEKEHTADIEIINGDLTKLCTVPETYKIKLKMDKSL